MELFTLANAQGVTVKITNYGGRIASLLAPDRRGKMANVVLGFDRPEGFLGNNPFFGAIIGRYANRIDNAQFTLGGKVYHLPANNGKNCLHGGPNGFDKKSWTAREIQGASPALELTYYSEDGEEGFPGNLTAKVTYTLGPNNELKMEYTATTDKETVVNLTNHAYFNLAGAENGNILKHEVVIDADHYTPIGPSLIPTGKIESVAGTPLDFRKRTRIGARINDDFEQLKYAMGYDFNYVLNRKGPGLAFAARVADPESGRVLEVLTTLPGIQFYTGNHLDGTIRGSDGRVYEHRGAFCLETQHFPDSPNHPNFPSSELKPGQTYQTTTVFRFGVE